MEAKGPSEALTLNEIIDMDPSLGDLPCVMYQSTGEHIPVSGYFFPYTYKGEDGITYLVFAGN